MITTINTSLPRIAIAASDDAKTFADVVKQYADSIGRVKSLTDEAGVYSLTINGNAAQDDGKPVLFNVGDDETLFALAYRGKDEAAALALDAVMFNFTAESSNTIETTLNDEPDETSARPKAKMMSAPQMSTPPLTATTPKTLYFTNTNASGSGSLRACFESANVGDTIEPAEALRSSFPLLIAYKYDFPIGEYTGGGVSLRSGVPGQKIVLDFKEQGGVSVSGRLAGQAFEDVVFLNVNNDANSYGVLQFAASASGSATFTRCGFGGWTSNSIVMFRHASTSTTARLTFDTCVFVKSANLGAVNGWALNGNVLHQVLNSTFNNNGNTGYFLTSSSAADLAAANCVCDVASASGTLCTLPATENDAAATFAILASNNDITGGASTGVDYFGNANDGTIGAISGGVYTNFETIKTDNGTYLGKFTNIANVNELDNVLTYTRIDRNIIGTVNARAKTDAAAAALFKTSEPLDKIATVPVYLAHATTFDYTVRVIGTDTAEASIIPAYMAHYNIGEYNAIDSYLNVTIYGAVCGVATITSGLDTKTLYIAPSIYYIGDADTISTLIAAQWSINGFSGTATEDITPLADARGYTFILNKSVTFKYAANASNMFDNRFVLHQGVELVVMRGFTDITQELKNRGLIVEYVPTSYLDYVFGDLVDTAVYALDISGVSSASDKAAFFGVHSSVNVDGQTLEIAEGDTEQ